MPVPFCERVMACLTKATKKEKEAIRRELVAHIEDHQDALIEKGMRASEAWDEAEAAMGDPEEVGHALNAQLSTFWLWAKRIAQGAVCVLLCLALMLARERSVLVTGGWDMLVGGWKNWKAHQGNGQELPWYTSKDVIRSWNIGETMQVGEEIICLARVDLTNSYADSGYYPGYFYFYTYHKNLFTAPNGEVLEHLTVNLEGGDEVDWYRSWGWQGIYMNRTGVIHETYCGPVKEGEAYVDVTYDHYGTCVTMRCYLDWGEEP